MYSKQIIVGCPNGFELLERLVSASSVKLAMAFAKPSGWSLVKDALLSSKKKISIVVGLNFAITDPKLLDEWLELCIQMPKCFEVRVAPEAPIFHPKIMIVRHKDGSCFAVVGSGNLTGGGQLHNVECGAYINCESVIGELEGWYEGLESKPLNSKIIEAYRPVYERTRKSGIRASSSSSELAAALNEGQSDWYEELFLEELTHFLSTPEGKTALKNRVNGAKQIQAALRMPQLNLTKAGWAEFYRMHEFGSIRLAYPEMDMQIGTLQRAFRFLLSKPLDEERLRAVLHRGGKHHVHGLGMNLISKVLTVSNRRQWPLLNVRVETTLFHYGYQVQWDASGYLRFAQDMRRCLSKSGGIDFWALDAFCEAKSRELDM